MNFRSKRIISLRKAKLERESHKRQKCCCKKYENKVVKKDNISCVKMSQSDSHELTH